MTKYQSQVSSPSRPFAEYIWLEAGITQEVIMVLFGSWIVAACAQIEVPMWPVPITAQTFGVLVVAGLLGSKRGAISLAAYVLQGSLGLPFFAGGGAGIATLLGPTGGYLIGFIGAAWVTGLLVEKGWGTSFLGLSLVMTVGTGVIFLFGVGWLANFVPPHTLLAVGLLPFLPGAVIKIAGGALVVKGATNVVKK